MGSRTSRALRANSAGSNWPIDVAKNTLLLRWLVVILRDDEVPKRCGKRTRHVGSNRTVSQNDFVTITQYNRARLDYLPQSQICTQSSVVDERSI